MNEDDAEEIVSAIWLKHKMEDNSGTDVVRQKLEDALLAAYSKGFLDGRVLEANGIVSRVTAAVKEHHDQKADDRCWMDDDKLYAAVGLSPPDRRVGDKAAMLENCKRFVSNRCDGGGPWKSYRELEAELADCKHQLAEALRTSPSNE